LSGYQRISKIPSAFNNQHSSTFLRNLVDVNNNTVIVLIVVIDVCGGGGGGNENLALI